MIFWLVNCFGWLSFRIRKMVMFSWLLRNFDELWSPDLQNSGQLVALHLGPVCCTNLGPPGGQSRAESVKFPTFFFFFFKSENTLCWVGNRVTYLINHNNWSQLSSFNLEASAISWNICKLLVSKRLIPSPNDLTWTLKALARGQIWRLITPVMCTPQIGSSGLIHFWRT